MAANQGQQPAQAGPPSDSIAAEPAHAEHALVARGPTGAAPPAGQEPPLRRDLDDGLRFLHHMGMQTKHDVFEVSTRLFALLEELVARGQVDLRSMDERRERLRRQEVERAQQQSHVQVAESVDKYNLRDLPQIDCAALLPICKGRCCRLSFPLSFQDLDERVLQWDYGRPYQIRKRGDAYCVHSEPATHRCTVYEKRPGICRSYDCRGDQRIWLDFERRIPAPDDLSAGAPEAGKG